MSIEFNQFYHSNSSSDSSFNEIAKVSSESSVESPKSSRRSKGSFKSRESIKSKRSLYSLFSKDSKKISNNFDNTNNLNNNSKTLKETILKNFSINGISTLLSSKGNNDLDNSNGKKSDNDENIILDNKNVKDVKADLIINNVYDSIEDLSESLKTLQIELKIISKKFSLLKKNYTKVINIKNKAESKKHKNKNKLQSGFVKPKSLSPEMCEFLNIDKDSKLGRNQVTSMINDYIVNNNLRDSKDRRIILPNDDLRKLLGLKDDDKTVITYFNLQTYLKQHFT